MLLFFIIKCSVDGNCLAGEINCLCIVYNVKPENVLFAHHDCCATNYKVLQTLKTQGNFSSLTSSPCISHGGNNTGNKSLVRGNFPLLQKFKKLISAIVATKSGHALERFQNVCGERDVSRFNKLLKLITSICLNHNIELVPQWFSRDAAPSHLADIMITDYKQICSETYIINGVKIMHTICELSVVFMYVFNMCTTTYKLDNLCTA